VRAVAPERAVEKEHTTRGQDPHCPGDQRLGHLPGRDVDQVDRHHRLGPIDRPGPSGYIQIERWAQGGRAGRAMGGDAPAHGRIGIARLPDQGPQLMGKPDAMLAGPAGHFQHQTLARQDPGQHVENRHLVAPGGGGEEARLETGGALGQGLRHQR
jgi:hypothetical protein